MTEKILVTCAHPDDETLGMGGTMALHSKKKDKILVLFFATGQFGRDNTPNGISKRRQQSKKACSILGVKNLKFFNYDDQKLDTIPVVELSTKIEAAMKTWNPTRVYTHHWGDLNQDHRKVFEATLIAARPTPSSKIKQLICYETPSSTDWGGIKDKFKPNLFINVSSVLEKKIRAFQEYKKEIHPYPHPRSKIALISRAQYWGSSVGVKHAEAFEIVREIIR